MFSRSTGRGYTVTQSLGDSVSICGAVSHANTMDGIRHLPACAKMFVGSVSEMPATHLATVFEVAGAITTVW